MNIADVDRLIIRGGGSDENPADLLFMADILGELASSDNRFGHLGPLDQRFPIPPELHSMIAKVKYAGGLLLCPIFDPVKHQIYAEEMGRVRRRYRGAAIESRLGGLFYNNAYRAMYDGSLASLDDAEASRLPKSLENGLDEPSIEPEFARPG